MIRIRKRRRKVSMHLVEGPTIEGFLIGRWSGHYIIDVPSIAETEERSHKLDGRVEIPAENVSFYQVLTG